MKCHICQKRFKKSAIGNRNFCSEDCRTAYWKGRLSPRRAEIDNKKLKKALEKWPEIQDDLVVLRQLWSESAGRSSEPPQPQ